MSITRVRLANEADRQGSNTDSPRVQESGRSLQVVIAENDNNRGLLGFTMETVSVVEGPIITLLVVRTRGTFGSVSVEYAIVDGGTNSGDYRPVSAALVVFASGQETASINILVTDDSLPEDDETFQVVLRNEMGGAEIGTPSFVTVTILSNDDVNGVFSFGDSSLLVRTYTLYSARPALMYTLYSARPALMYTLYSARPALMYTLYSARPALMYTLYSARPALMYTLYSARPALMYTLYSARPAVMYTLYSARPALMYALYSARPALLYALYSARPALMYTLYPLSCIHCILLGQLSCIHCILPCIHCILLGQLSSVFC